MAILTFARYSDVERWNAIERKTPAGLSPGALALTSAIETTPGDFKDDAALGARDATTAKVRRKLMDNPKWKAISDSKKNVRSEKPPVLADANVPR